jgi:hypothetical protein
LKSKVLDEECLLIMMIWDIAKAFRTYLVARDLQSFMVLQDGV